MNRLNILIKYVACSIYVNFKSRLIYRWDFIVAIVIKSIETLISFILLEFMLDKIFDIGGFNRAQMILMFGISELSFSIWHCFFINSLSIGAYIRTGYIDRFLLRPISPVMQIIMDGFDEDGWGGLIISFIIIGIGVTTGVGNLSLTEWIMIMILAVCGSLIFFSISLLLSSASFWAKTNTNLGLLVMELRVFARFPLTIYPRWYRIVLSTILPLAVCGYWPTLYLLNGHILPVLITIASTIIFFGLSIVIFNSMLKISYESTGT